MPNMNDIIRKQMKDVIVQHNDVVRRPSTVPEPYVAPVRDDEGDRIGKNPFFEKPRKDKTTEPEKTKHSSNKGIIWALLFVLLLGLGFVVANYFATATIEITPVTRSASIDSDFAVLKDASEGDLAFQFMSLTDEKTKELPATIEKKLQKKASGKVTIFNSYNKDSQRLIKNTRLESPDHKIFHVDQSIVVPGMKVVDGKNVPGSVEALIYADVPGKEYNIAGLVDFTIPGFKGDPRYTKFKAMTIPNSPIGGGFSGTVKVPSDEAVAQAQEELKQDLKKEATEKARAQVPPSVSFFPGSVILKFEEVPQEFTAEATAKVSMRATVSVFFFDTVMLTQKLALLSMPEEKGGPFVISNMSALDYNFIDPVDNVVLSDLSKIHFHIKGSASFVGQVDTQKIRTELVGKNKKDFSKIIEGQSNISKADAVVRPMWKTVFPNNPSKITVKLLDK